MGAFDRVMSRPAVTARRDQGKMQAEPLWSALRADLRSRDERMARLRAMALADVADRTE
jgi:hypothetical protein